MNKTKLIPFDIELAKAGAKVVTRIGKPVRVGFYDVKNENFPILCLVEEDNGRELSWGYTKNGKYHKDEDTDSPYDLFIEEEVKTRRMTYQELADWLRDCPEEHRECRYRHNTTISPYLYYNLESANKEAKGLLVRRNHGEWEEPLIKE